MERNFHCLENSLSKSVGVPRDPSVHSPREHRVPRSKNKFENHTVILSVAKASPSEMSVQTMKLIPEHYYNIVAGNKKYEIRAFDKKRQELKINTNIVFANKETEEVITKRITELSYFPDTTSLFNSSVPLTDMLPGVSSVNEAEQIINSIPNMSAKIDIFGIVRIKLGDIPREIFRAHSH